MSCLGGLRAVVLALALVPLTGPAHAKGDPPTYEGSTWVGDEQLPVATATGSAGLVGAMRMHFTYKGYNVDPAVTRVVVTWTTPLMRPQRSCFGRLKSTYENWRGAGHASGYTLAVRYRVRNGTWNEWHAVLGGWFEDPPAHSVVAVTTTDDCLLTLPRSHRGSIEMQVRYDAEHFGTTEYAVSAEISAG